MRRHIMLQVLLFQSMNPHLSRIIVSQCNISHHQPLAVCIKGELNEARVAMRLS